MQKIKKAQNVFSFVAILSECSHIFCCVLPTMFSVLSVLVGLGIIGAVPVWLSELHYHMHDWEIPIILGSGAVVVLGWGLHYLSIKMDCHDTGCAHGACTSKKNKNLMVLQIATALFLVNIAIYIVFHQGMETFRRSVGLEQQHHDH